MKRALLLTTMFALPATSLAADAAKGKTIYTANCMACHGLAGDGAGPAAMALDPKPTDFTKPEFWKERTNAELKRVIKTGKPGTTMAPFPQLSDDDVADLIAYLRSFDKPPAAKPAPSE